MPQPRATEPKRKVDAFQQGMPGGQVGVNQSEPGARERKNGVEFNPLATAAQVSSNVKNAHGIIADGQDNWAPNDPQQKKSYDARNRVRGLAIPNAAAAFSNTAEKQDASKVEVARDGLGLTGHVVLTAHGATSEIINNAQKKRAQAPTEVRPPTSDGPQPDRPRGANPGRVDAAPSGASASSAPAMSLRGEQVPRWISDPWPSSKPIEAAGWPSDSSDVASASSGHASSASSVGDAPATGASRPAVSGNASTSVPSNGDAAAADASKPGSFYKNATPAQRVKLGTLTGGVAAFAGSDALGLAHSIRQGDVPGTIMNTGYLVADGAAAGGLVVGTTSKNPVVSANGFKVANAGAVAGHLLGPVIGGYDIYNGVQKLKSGNGTGVFEVASGSSAALSGVSGLLGLGAGIAGKAGLSAVAGKVGTVTGVAAPLAIGLIQGSIKAADRSLAVKSDQAAFHAEQNLTGDRNNVARSADAASRNLQSAVSMSDEAGNPYRRLITNNPVNQLLQASPRGAFQNGVKPVNDWLGVRTSGDNGGWTQIDLSQKESAPDASGLSYLGEGAERTYTLSENRGLENYYRNESKPIYTASSPGQALGCRLARTLRRKVRVILCTTTNSASTAKTSTGPCRMPPCGRPIPTPTTARRCRVPRRSRHFANNTKPLAKARAVLPRPATSRN